MTGTDLVLRARSAELFTYTPIRRATEIVDHQTADGAASCIN
jgi:hypothetical protein